MLIDTKHKDAPFIRVYVDGKEKEGVMSADTEKGFVICYKLEHFQDGRVRPIVNLASRRLETERITGHVTLVDKRTGKPYLEPR